MSWKQDQEFEADWWSDCGNTFQEEQKQQVYLRKMGLVPEWDYGHFPVYDMKGISVCDIGGGPVSPLLKGKNVKGTVVDPCNYPNWVFNRYTECGIEFIKKPAEDFVTDKTYDEVWIMNCLQHTIDPEKIIKNALNCCKVLRIFEWIDMPPTEGHPQELKEDKLNKWLGGVGKVEEINESGCRGRCYYGVFKGKYYE